MGKCIACGLSAGLGEVFCDSCKGAGCAPAEKEDIKNDIQKVRGCLVLRKGEQPVRWLLCSSRQRTATLDGASAPVTLYVLITDQRLVAFEGAKRDGVPEIYASIELEDIEDVHVRPGYFSDSITVDNHGGSGPDRVELWSVKDLDVERLDQTCLTDLVAVRDQLKALVEQRTSLVSQRDLMVRDEDFETLREELAEGGVVLKCLRCTRCGTSVEIPSSGGSVKCNKCDCTILANEVAARLRASLGHA